MSSNKIGFVDHINYGERKRRLPRTRKVAGISLRRTLGRIGGRCRWAARLGGQTITFDAAMHKWSSYIHPKGNENSYVLSAPTLRACVIATQHEMVDRRRRQRGIV